MRAHALPGASPAARLRVARQCGGAWGRARAPRPAAAAAAAATAAAAGPAAAAAAATAAHWDAVYEGGALPARFWSDGLQVVKIDGVKGRGVVARRPIARGELLLVAPPVVSYEPPLSEEDGANNVVDPLLRILIVEAAFSELDRALLASLSPSFADDADPDTFCPPPPDFAGLWASLSDDRAPSAAANAAAAAAEAAAEAAKAAAAAAPPPAFAGFVDVVEEEEGGDDDDGDGPRTLGPGALPLALSAAFQSLDTTVEVLEERLVRNMARFGAQGLGVFVGLGRCGG